MITIKNLNKYYNKGKKNEQHVLNDISLELGETGLVCILGESGSGKTTLLNTLGGIDTFSSGSIAIDDTVVEKYDPKVMEPVRNDHFDYVFQNYYLLQDYSVAYNIKLALNRYELSEEEKDARVDYVLEMLGIAKYKKKPVSKLSGGQKQRVSIARALVKSPDVIFADEPTGNLDEENTLRTMSILKNISKECLVLLVSHEKRIANFFADRVIEICDGRVVRDEPNTPLESYERSDDANIYLKEMEQSSLADQLAEFKIYTGKNTEPKKIELTLAWKDDKLYIQNNMPYDILIEGVENGVEIKDEERPKIDMEDIDNFTYELPKMKSKGKSQLPGRKILRMALENIQMMGKKQAFVIGILLVTAVLLSVTMAQFISSVSVDEAAVRATDSHYTSFAFVKSSLRMSHSDQEKIQDYIDNHLANQENGSVFYVPASSIYLVGSGYEQLDHLTQMIENFSYVSLEHLSEDKLVYGKMPEKRNEIVMDMVLIDRIIASKGAVSSLHDGPESYIGTKVAVGSTNIVLTITGICNTEEPSVYCGQNVLLGINGMAIASVDELKAADLDDYTVPELKEDEVLVRQGLYDAQEDKKSEIEFGDEVMTSAFKIVGTFPDEMNADYVFAKEGCDVIRNQRIQESKSCMIYSENAQKTKQYFEDLGRGAVQGFTMELTVPSQDEVAEYKDNHSVDMDAKQLITFVIVIISMIMVYFTIKSNAMSRSEELTVYRLIGISRGSILKAYMLEMVLMTCYTSLPAVLITSGVIQFISSIPSLEISMIFPWWSVLLLLVVIYAVHMVISIMPVYGILSKPPAALAVKQ